MSLIRTLIVVSASSVLFPSHDLGRRKKNPDGSRSGYYGPDEGFGDYDSGPAGGASSGGNYGGNQNTGSDNNNAPDTGGHSRFDVGSGYYGEEVTDKGGSGDTITNEPDTFYDDEITRKNPIERIKTNYTTRKKDFKYNQKKDAVMLMAKAAFMGIGPYGVYDFAKKQNQKKTDYINSVKKDIEKLKELGVPEYSPHTDTLIQTLEQDILDLTQPKSKDDEDDGGSEPVIQQIMVAKETVEDRDETDIFNIWDKIKAKQAQRSMLVEKGIIQDNTQDQTIIS